ncbi:hypothetical protein [Gemmata sp.]
MLTSAGLSDHGTLLAPVEEFRTVTRDDHRDAVPADFGDLWIDLGGGD